MVVKEMLLPQETLLIQLDLLELEQLGASILNTVELKLELNFLRVIGYGLLFGYFLFIMNMDLGQLLEK